MAYFRKKIDIRGGGEHVVHACAMLHPLEIDHMRGEIGFGNVRQRDSMHLRQKLLQGFDDVERRRRRDLRMCQLKGLWREVF